ncbi:hypothetical protein K505DRAFT_380674 [Melanomma pulvis-pyrius CBS 109.77]|uniref:Uncharacterized protein n=1 Tax=Melanomma pulvis-pyrius CBS 109.77 TaxID=1314802 RepID=A0A6A6WPG7_9PLEO|nr:hypothetical protein K505DRAFT_380674 [Melanomma pulvis-pyrius CBS 109.77]
MAGRKSRRKASQKATKAIAAGAGVSKNRQSAKKIPAKYTRSNKSPRLPEGKLTARKASHIERTANAREAKSLARMVGYSADPIQEFNDLQNSQKELLMKSLLLDFSRFLYVGGRNLAPADLHGYSTIGLPATDRAVLRGTPLRQADEDSAPRGKSKPAFAPTTIHGKARWPPNLDIGGACSCSINMDAHGRVDLEHDPYCLRKHFTTRWGVLEVQSETGWGPPQGGATVRWSDSDIIAQTEGNESGLWVDLKQKSYLRSAYTQNTSLVDLISSPWLLHRIVANFGAPPFTENDPYKCSWSFSFWSQEDPTCYLEIREHKGWPQAHFVGGEKASNEALQLLEWLGGDNCPLSYDYTPCGVHA